MGSAAPSVLRLAYRQASELHAQWWEAAEREMRGPGTATMGLALSLALCYTLATSAIASETAYRRNDKSDEDLDLGAFDSDEQERRWQACP